MSPDQSPKKRANTQAANDDGLLDGLESLLEEEGMDLDDDDLDEDELDDLFDGDDDNGSVDVPPSQATRSRPTGHSAREGRRNRDREAFQNLDAQMQLDPQGITISEDKLTATLTRITADNDYEGVISYLRGQGISSGIDQEGIRAAISKAYRGQGSYGIVVARGKAPRIIKEAEVAYHLPPEVIYKNNTSEKMTDFEVLKHILEGPYIEALKSYKGVVKPVKPGDLISEIVPAEIEIGEDIFGNPIEIEQEEELYLQMGDNTDLSEDGMTCVSAIYGYAGILDNIPTVLPPIWVTEDHMEAHFVYIEPPADIEQPAPTVEDLRYLLEIMWIHNGLMEKQFQLIQQRLENQQPLPITLPIAEGTHEVPGDDAQINYAFDAFSVLPWNHIQTVMAMQSPEEMAEAIENIYAEEETPTFTAFGPGQVVIEKSPATNGIVGVDIQGEKVTPEPGVDIPLEFGDYLKVTKDDLRCHATIFGYVCLQWDIQVILLSPLWISPDKTRVYFLNFPQGNNPRYPLLEEMQLLLKDLEITYGFHAERWVEIREELENGQRDDRVILIAEGRSAQPGRDASFDWVVDVGDEKKIGKVLEDGSIDFRERNLITVVQENDMLGRLVPPQPGVVGKDVFGNELRPPSPVNIEVVTDSRIYAEPEDDGVIAFFAEIGGGISTSTKEKKVNERLSRRINVGVNPISNIEGDIDYTTGNIEFNGDVVIGGSVQPQFSVRATGSVTIEGYVEAGAYITAGKDIIIKRGVIGATTELVAGENVMAKYIQEATVRAGGNVRVGSYMFNASVRTSGQVVVTGKGEGKSRALVGGLIWAAHGILAKSIGSPYNTGTKLVAGIDPESVNRAEQIRANMQTCNDKQRAMLERIGVPNLNVALIKQKLAFCRSPKDKQKILMMVKRIAKVAELEQSLQKELEETAEAQRKLALRTNISVHSQLFAGAELRIGELTKIVHDDENNISFSLVEEDDEQKIKMGPYKGAMR
ncbi:MAG: hypothetical protein ACI906_000365 [Candidatus Latescibacterota bacterium]|jgi:uncharacterized protein (DUF342 family)